MARPRNAIKRKPITLFVAPDVWERIVKVSPKCKPGVRVDRQSVYDKCFAVGLAQIEQEMEAGQMT